MMKKRILLSLIPFLSSCTHVVNVSYLNTPLLIPWQQYDFQLAKDFKVKIDSNIIIVPRGFISDFASIPRILWPIYAPHDTATLRASVLHDYLYICNAGYTRRQSDLIFYYALLNSGVTKFKAYKYFLAVRLFGWRYWRENLC